MTASKFSVFVEIAIFCNLHQQRIRAMYTNHSMNQRVQQPVTPTIWIYSFRPKTLFGEFTEKPINVKDDTIAVSGT